MRRKGKDKEGKHDNLERWLLTYADMITLLMAFFIMMYSMSILNLAKFREAAFSIRSGFGGVVPGQGRSILGTGGTFAAKPSPIEGDTAGVEWKVIKPLVNYIEKEGGVSHSVSIGQDERGIVITMLSDRMLFDPGSAQLKAAAFPALDRIAETVEKTANRIQVIGHTCDLRPRGSRYAGNLELSLARARSVLVHLTRLKGLKEERFSIAGYGSTMPAQPNTNEANRRRNRRVEIVILRPETPSHGPEKPAARPRSSGLGEIRSRRD